MPGTVLDAGFSVMSKADAIPAYDNLPPTSLLSLSLKKENH